MARIEIPIVVLHPTTGEYVSGAECTVTQRPGGGAATVYNAETGSTPITQPLTSDTEGRLTGWVDRGRYTATITVSGFASYPIYFDSAPGEDGAITSAWIADGAVTTTKILDNAVTQEKLADASVGINELRDGNISTAKIIDGNVTNAKLGQDSVDSAKLKDDAVTDANRAVTTNHIRDAAVTTGKLNDGAVTTAKITDANVTAAKLGAYAADATTGKVNLGWFTSANSIPTGNFQISSSTFTTVTGATITGVAPGIYLAIPRLQIYPVANLSTNFYTAESRLYHTSGTVGYGGETIETSWYATDGAGLFGSGSSKQVNLSQILWVTATANLAIQVRSPANTYESVVKANSAKIEMIRIA